MKKEIEEIYSKIKEEYSGEKAKEFTLAISRFHRIQVSPWFSESVKFCSSILKNTGINFKVYKLPSDGKKTYFTMNSFKEWVCKKGVLYLEEPFKKKIADFDEVKLRVIPRSGKAKGFYDVVYYDGGRKKNFKNKLILTSKREFVNEDFLQKVGAKGVLFFGMAEIENLRRVEDLMDALQYVSFWPEKKNKFFGFILSPLEGKYLKNLLVKNKVLKVYVEVKSEFMDGFIEVLDAWIKGKKDEEVWVVAHLCHPAPFVNDNASGAGCALELARSFKRLFNQEALKRPLRTIRFLLLPEMTGTYAYLKFRERDLDRVKGAINLDMVGEEQEKCKSTFNLIKEPYGIMSYASYLSQIIFEWAPFGYKNFYGTDFIPFFRKKVSEYSGGSDHYILIDPRIGVPCVMLGQWPDKFYHTSFDNEDKVSKNSLKFAGSFAGTFIYYLANLNNKKLYKLADKMNEMFLKGFAELKINEQGKAKEKLLYFSHMNALNSLKKFDRGFKSDRFLKKVEKYVDEKALNIVKRAKRDVPVRNFKAPLYMRALIKKMSRSEKVWLEEMLKKKRFLRHSIELFIYYIDGNRTLSEIMRMIEIETGRREDIFIKKFYNLLKKYGFLKTISLTNKC